MSDDKDIATAMSFMSAAGYTAPKVDHQAEAERLRALLLDACQVFDKYDLPEHAFHYRREVLGLEQAKKIARGEQP